MIKKLLFLVVLLLTININTAVASTIDTSYTEGLTAFEWAPISDVDKVLQHENAKDISKRSISQTKLAEEHYTVAIELMKKKEYFTAINEFKSAIKRYKRAKLSNDALNFIRANMALSYASTGNKEDVVVSKRLLDLITSKAYSDNKWTYNIAIAHHKVGNKNEAASLLSSAIRKDEFYFQAYITLEDIYRISGNHQSADKVIDRMQKAEKKLNKKKSSIAKGGGKKKNSMKVDSIPSTVPKKPDITNLKIVSKDDHQQFNKGTFDDRNMIQIQEGIGEYNLGVKALSNKNCTMFVRSANKSMA